MMKFSRRAMLTGIGGALVSLSATRNAAAARSDTKKKVAEMISRISDVQIAASTRRCTVLPEHVFQRGELDRRLRLPQCKVIVTHGIELEAGHHNGWDFHDVGFEILTVFTAKYRKNRGYSEADIYRVLAGDITNWSEFDQEPAPINVLGHGGRLQRESFKAFVRQAGLDLDRVEKLVRRPGRTYQSLERAGAADPDAMVIGLRGIESNVLSPVLINWDSPYEVLPTPKSVPRIGIPCNQFASDGRPKRDPVEKDQLAAILC